MTEELKEIGCSCHFNPPCSFCMALNEEEADIMWNDGLEALKEYWRKQDDLVK